MKKSNGNWFWNIVIIATLIACALAFVLHYKNWSKFEDGALKITSGIYRQAIPLSELDSISMVPKLPQMERMNGFSWLAKEKGIFKDSLTDAEAYVFVDDLRQHKIRIVHHDSLKLYVNFSDSLETHKVYTSLKQVLEDGQK